MLQRACLVLSLLLLLNLLTAQATWHWGFNTHIGLSGWPDSGQGEGTRPGGVPYRFTAKERLQPTYGAGAWIAMQASEHWSLQVGLTYRKASKLAIGYYEEGPVFESRWARITGWRSQYIQLPTLLRYRWRSPGEGSRPYVGIGLQPTFLLEHQYHSCYCDIEGVPGDLLAGVFQNWTDNAALDSEELERSRLHLAGLFEFGLEVNKFTMALGTTLFFQGRREGVPGYLRSLPYIEDENGTFIPQGTPVRYVSSLDVKLYYAIR